MLDILGDKREAKGGWCPGDYQCKCLHCSTLFIGAKRSTSCADCAYCEHDFRLMYRHTTSDVKCTKCGMILTHEAHMWYKNKKLNQELNDIGLEIKKEIGAFASTGWICPVCGRGNSPFNKTCPCKEIPASLFFNKTYSSNI